MKVARERRQFLSEQPRLQESQHPEQAQSYPVCSRVWQAGEFGARRFFLVRWRFARRRPKPAGKEVRRRASKVRARENWTCVRVLARFAGRGVGIIAERSSISVGEDFHQPSDKSNRPGGP